MLVGKFLPTRLFVICLAYFMIMVIVGIYSATRAFNNSLFDYVINLRGGGSADVIPIYLGALPILALMLPLLIDKFEGEMIVLRIQNKRKLFYQYLAFSIVLSAVLTLLMVVSGIVASLILTGNLDNLWGDKSGALYFILDNKAYFALYISHVTSGKIWSYIVSSRFLTLLFICSWILFLKLLLKRNIYTFIVSVLLLTLIDSFLPNQFNLFIGRSRIPLDLWLDPFGQLFNLGYFFLIIIILSYISLHLYDKKEFYSNAA